MLSKGPECFLSFFLLDGIIVYIRFIHVKALVSSLPKQKTIRKLNIAAIVVGTISAFGMSVLGNFQVRV